MIRGASTGLREMLGSDNMCIGKGRTPRRGGLLVQMVAGMPPSINSDGSNGGGIRGGITSDKLSFKLPLFSFAVEKTDSQMRLRDNETIILRYWSWRRMGHVRKALTLSEGVVRVQGLD